MTSRLLVLLVCLVGCTSQTPQATSTPTPAPTHSPVPVERSLELATQAADGSGAVELYRIDEGRQAHLLRTVRRPAWADSTRAMQLASGDDPPLCVLFGAGQDQRAEAHCYRSGTTAADVLPMTGAMSMLLSGDGRSVVWMTAPTEAGAFLEKDDLVAGALTRRGRLPLARLQHALASACPGSITDIAWAGGPDLVLRCVPAARDETWTVLVPDLDAVLAGAAPAGAHRVLPTGPLAVGYNQFYEVTPLDATTAIAELAARITCSGSTCTPAHPPQRKAVVLTLRSGRVLSEVATPAAGRSFDALGGGARGLLYVTRAARAPAVYVRWPGEAHGKRVTGLASGWQVIAQR